MPCAIWVGHHGATILASTWTTAFGVDELQIAQVLLNEPLELVKCKTVDLEVPASAEIVIEGLVPPDIVEDEGPFGEHTGCTIAGGGKNEIVQVKAITMRKDALLFQITEGPSTDGAILDSIPMEVELFNRLKDVGGYVQLHNVVVHECAGGGHFVIIQMTPRVDGEVKGVLMAALSSNYLHHKIAVAVDDDVDPFIPSEVIWSMSTKVNPVDDVFIVQGTRGHSLDSSLPRVSPKGVNPVIRVGSRMGIDATKPPLIRPDERAELERIFPKGYGKIKLEDFLKP
jgi:2,5-furandicarboxylate decarboxylase 1